MKIDADGHLFNHHDVQFIASPNYDERPPETEVTLLVIHNISLPPGEFGGNGIIELFTNALDPKAHPYYETIATLKVSSHFLIRRNGTVIQFVSCHHRAWHAGPSNWQGKTCCNDFSVGIELEGSDSTPFNEKQYDLLASLTRGLCKSYPIQSIVGHETIAPERKTDPGPYFDWRCYRNLLDNDSSNNTKVEKHNNKFYIAINLINRQNKS